jgi:hypothetical protein
MKTGIRTNARADRFLPRSPARIGPGGDLAELFPPDGPIARMKWRIRERILMLFRRPAKPEKEAGTNGRTES